MLRGCLKLLLTAFNKGIWVAGRSVAYKSSPYCQTISILSRTPGASASEGVEEEVPAFVISLFSLASPGRASLTTVAAQISILECAGVAPCNKRIFQIL